MRAIRCSCFATVWKARFRRVSQRDSTSRSCSSRVWSLCRRRWACGSGASAAGVGRRRRRRAWTSSGALDELEFDATVLQGLLGHQVAALLSFQADLLHGIRLEEAIELALGAPVALEVVVL